MYNWYILCQNFKFMFLINCNSPQDIGESNFEKLKNNENEIEVGEQVVTSHVSDRFLQGLFIGYISEINVDSNNLTRSGYITPAVDFSQLQEVLVITTTKDDLINAKDNSANEGE